MKKIIIVLSLIFILSSFVNAIDTNNNVLYYNIDDINRSVNTIYDISDSGLTGTNNGGVLGVTGLLSEAINLDTNTDYIQTNDNVLIDNYQQLTYNIWYKGTDTMVTDYGIMTKSDTGDYQQAMGGLGTVNGVRCKTFQASGTTNALADSTSAINDDNWHMITCVYDNNVRVGVYIDGVSEANDTSFVGTWNYEGAKPLMIGKRQDYNGVIGLFDEASVWNKSLTQAEILELYKGGIGYNPYAITNIIPNITQIYPINNDHLNDDPILLQFNVTDTDDDLLNCTIKENNVLKTTFTNINTTSNPIQYYNLTTTEGVKNWTVNCTDGTEWINKTEDFIVDRTSPDWTIRTINTDNTSIIDRSTVNYIYFNDSVDDTYLFNYNVTTLYPNGTIWFTNQTLDLNVSNFDYQYNVSINPTQPNGTYTTTYYAEDDHTAKKIPHYQYIKKSDGLEFTTSTGTQISVNGQKNDMKSVNTTKLIDRYTFDFEYTNNKKTRTYYLTSSEKLWYRDNLYPFPAFVTGKNWVDFNLEDMQGITYDVIKIDDYNYEITITREVGKKIDKIRSLGGLNIVNETYTFMIKENQAPNITSTTPTSPINTFDGTYLNFTTTANDPDNDTITYKYYYNNILNYTGQNLTNFYTPFNSHGINNMTVIVSDGGKSDNYTWTINITHNPVPASVTSLTRDPLTTWYSNINASFVCTGVDNDNETAIENMSAEIEYRTGILWNSLTVTNNNDTTFTAPIDLSTLTGETLDVRCRITDFDFGFTPWTQINNIVTVQEAYISVGNITKITPTSGSRDYITPVTCSPSSYGSIKSYKLIYDIDAYYSGSWHNLSNGLFNKALFDMSVLSYGDNVSFRCKANDGITETDFYQGGNITRTHINNLFMYSKGRDEILQKNKPYHKGLIADFYNEPNISIVSSFVDCNDDGYWDYYFSYNDSRNNTREDFMCVNTKGVIKHTVGIFVEKTGVNNLFCGTKTNGLCRIERSYDVIVR